MNERILSMNEKSSRCVLIIYIRFTINIFQSAQLYNKSTGYSDMFRLKMSSPG